MFCSYPGFTNKLYFDALYTFKLPLDPKHGLKSTDANYAQPRHHVSAFLKYKELHRQT